MLMNNTVIMKKLLIIQPWFTAIGHPAQSLINMAAAIGKSECVDYLISSSNDLPISIHNSIKQLSSWGVVESYPVTASVGVQNTIGALLKLLRLHLKGRKYQRILFFDESLFVLALFWPLFSICLSVERLGVLHLFGPELGRRQWFSRFIIGRFLKRREVSLYLRTDELAQSWIGFYKKTAKKARITTLPSLEIPDDLVYECATNEQNSEQLRFGVIGQIRMGKGIEWLVPAFKGSADLGKLTVAGEFNVPETREQLSVLGDFDGFLNCFMSEVKMLEVAAGQDYLLMLYDKWDKRMESAVLYLAARVNRPVVVYGDSWSGRMVREFGCGVEAPVDRDATLDLLLRLPRPGSEEYAGLLKGMDVFREAYSVKSLRGKVIQELLG